MNFIEEILKAGFVEQGQRSLLQSSPQKEKWIPKWWEHYPFSSGWFGVCIDHPDAWFQKSGFDGEVRISLQGCLTRMLDHEDEDIKKYEKYSHIMQAGSCRYIAFIKKNEIIYETFFGELPSKTVLDKFLQ